MKRFLLILISSLIISACDDGIEEPNPGPLPIADFIFQQQANNPREYSFASTSVNEDFLQWDFGDGSGIETGVSATHEFLANRSFEVTLTAANRAGVNSKTVTITVNEELDPVADFLISFNSGADALTVNLLNLSQNFSNVTWSFGDGNTSNDPNLTGYTYDASGNYRIRLDAFNQDGSKEDDKRIDFRLFDETIAAGKTWAFRTEMVNDNAPFFVERDGIFAFEYTFEACELNDEFLFNDDGTYLFENNGDLRYPDRAGVCDVADPYESDRWRFRRANEEEIQLDLGNSAIGEIFSGPLYDVLELTEEYMILSVTRPNPFNSNQNETLVMTFEPL